MTTLAEFARHQEARLPGLENVANFRAIAPRFALLAPVSYAGEQLSERTARRVQREMVGLLAELHDVVVLALDSTRASLGVVDCLTRRLAPAVLRADGHEDLAAALENLPEISGPSGVERALGVFSALTYLVHGEAGELFYAVVEALELPSYGSADEVDRGTLAMRSFPASFARRASKAFQIAERLLSDGEVPDESTPYDPELQTLRPSVEVAAVAAGPKLRSIAS